MTRARFVLGDDALRERFEAVRDVLTAPRDSAALASESFAIASACAPHHPARFDVKHSAGGMVDAESVYATSGPLRSYPELIPNPATSHHGARGRPAARRKMSPTVYQSAGAGSTARWA